MHLNTKFPSPDLQAGRQVERKITGFLARIWNKSGKPAYRQAGISKKNAIIR
jgi:hypothetical protein